MTSSLKNRAVKGVAWNLIEKFGDQGMRFVLGVIMARLLTPEDYGLIGMMVVFFTVSQSFIDGGFGQAYIQKKHVTDQDADTVFYTNLVISFFCYAILWIIAPGIASFYDQPQLLGLMRVMGLIIIIDAFSIIQQAMIKRELKFKLRTKIILFVTPISGTAGVVAAYNGLGVWSLVIQQMLNRLLISLGLWFNSTWKPLLRFSKDSFKSLFSFGMWVLVSGLITRIFDNFYALTIGKIFPMAQLGFYTNAKKYQQLSSMNLSLSVVAVAFPIFAKLQTDKMQFKNAMRTFLQHVAGIVFPVLVIVMVVADSFVMLFLTEKWAPMIPYLQLLCLAGMLYPLHLINVQALHALGKSRLNFNLSIIKNALRVVNIIVMFRWGVIYIIIGEIFVSVLSFFINTYYSRCLINYGPCDQLKDIFKTIMASVGGGGAGYCAMMPVQNLYYDFCCGILVTSVVYVLLQYVTNRRFFMEIVSLNKIFKKPKTANELA